MQGYVDAGGKILRYPERLAQWKQGRDLYPGNVELDLSDRCNRKCRGCHFAYHAETWMEQVLGEVIARTA